MAYAVVDKKNRSNGDSVGIRSIALDDDALEKVFPDTLTPFAEAVNISDDFYNLLRLENSNAVWQDGTLATSSDYVNPPATYTAIKMNTWVQMMEKVILTHFDEENYVDRDDWEDYLSELKGLDFSTISGGNIPEIIENKGVTYRSIFQLPWKLNS